VSLAYDDHERVDCLAPRRSRLHTRHGGGDITMKLIESPWVRTLFVTLAAIAMSAATAGCDWANVPGPW
jgi:hypothetical protein